jgi:outer membrane protein OmpA-like peptidoglycan-associated protein
MFKRKGLALAGMLIAVLVVSPACVSKKLFRKNNEQTDSRVTGVETAVEENERRISDLRSETDSKIAAVDNKADRAVEIGNSAMSSAKNAQSTAEAAARGRLLWEVHLTDDRVKFSFNEASLSDEAKGELDNLAGQVKNLAKAVYLEIEGHTDNIGSEDYNVKLGHDRAMAALRYLNETGGIPLHAMNAISYGSAKPLTDNDTREGRAQNRRVVIRVLE